MPKFLTLDDFDPNGKTVLLRADLNVPVKDGAVSDATRIERLAPTILELAQKGAKLVVMSHFGRPKGKDPALSLKPIALPLSQALGGRLVTFATDCIGPAAQAVVKALAPGDIALLENLRFHDGEEKNDPAFARQLAALGETLRQRRLLRGPSRARLDRGDCPSPARLCRAPDAGRARRARRGARIA